jgi:sugar lactone lactonase YvrE
MRLLSAAILTLTVSFCALGQTYSIRTFAGGGLPVNIPATSAVLQQPGYVAVDAEGNLFFSVINHAVLRLDATTGSLTLVAGNGTAGYSGDDGPASRAQLDTPTGLAVDSAGNVYIADFRNNRIREVSDGTITTVAGTGVPGYGGNNGPATSAQLYNPTGVAVDPAGNLYIADAGNNRIRKVSNGVITTVAGDGIQGFSGDNGPATTAQLNIPNAVAVDAAGNLYIADDANNRIRKVSNGVIVTVAGNGTAGYSGDNGPATSAQLNEPLGIAVDAAGSLYIGDFKNQSIRRVSGGVITTVAGNGTDGYSGDNGLATSAQLHYPNGVAVDLEGNLYIADVVNDRIRKVSNGMIATVAGDGTSGLAGDGGPAVSGEFVEPLGRRHGLRGQPVRRRP